MTLSRFRRAAFASALILAAPGLAAATPTVGELPLMRQAIIACGADVATLCPSVVPGGGRIAQCLSDRRAELSPACAETVDRGMSLKNAMLACSADAQRYCADVPLGGGRVAACLRDNDISAPCRDAMTAAESAWTP